MKSIDLSVQCSLIRDFKLNKLEQGHNTTEATKNMSCANIEGAVVDSQVIKAFKKFRSSWKNLDDQTRFGRLKTENSEAVL